MKKIIVLITAVFLVTLPMSAFAFMDTINSGPRAESDSTNLNTNLNANTNLQGQAQGQLQGQLQGQAQGQGQAQKVENANNAAQSVTFISPDNKRELPNIVGYQAPAGMEYRGPYEKGVAGKVKPWIMRDTWTKEELDGMYSMSDSAECKVFVLVKKEEATATVKVIKANVSTDKLIAIMECKAESDIEMWGTAGTKTLAAGGKSVEEMAYSVTYSNRSKGWNIGFGGGVTAINGGNDTFGGSVGGGTGFGSVESTPVSKITAIFAIR